MRALSAALVLLLSAATAAYTQVIDRTEVRAYEPSVALELLASARPGGSTIVAAFAENYAKYTDAQRQQLLDGVERIARGEVEGPELTIRRAITMSFSILSAIALYPAVVAPEAREIPARLLRIYRQSDRVDAKALALMRLGDMLLLSPREAPEIIRLLEAVASAPPEVGKVSPRTALDALRNAEEAGIPSLRRLYAQDLVKDPIAQMELHDLARRGFPVSPVRPGPSPRRRN